MRVTRAQTACPQILSAYDAVCVRAQAEGRSPGVAPREVYFADWAGLGETDPACDVALPLSG
ncbi:hypothetical protein [Streptomyces sp. NPDC012888]|uniref:hypothetical protein n=1 Tax=Streptomyces sp. NPDC012888 TaxID=3364855 RepID=UPI0036C84496